MLSRVRDFYLRLSIKMKLILALMMVAIIFISILSCAYYWYMKKEVVLRTEKTLENNIEIMSEQMTSLLSEIDSYAELIAGDEEVQKAIRENDSYNLIESINAKNEMGITLSHMINTSKSIDAVIVYTQNHNGYSSYPVEDEKMKEYFYNFPQDIKPIGNRKKMMLDETFRNSVIHYNGILLFNYDINDKYTGKKIGNINFIVLQSQISGYFSQFSTHPNDVVGIIDNSGNEIVTYPYKFVEDINLSAIDNDIIFENNALMMKTPIDNEWNLYQKMSLQGMNEELRNLVIITILLAFVVLGLLFFFSNWLFSISLSPLRILRNAMVNVSKGDMKTKVYIQNKDEIGSLADIFNQMIENTDLLMMQLVEEQKAKRKYEYMLVQAQINPHFLYNTLETICGLAELGENKKILNMVGALSMFYKNMLTSGRNIITLKEETLVVKSYMDILNIRFPNKFSYKINIPQELSEVKCLKLTLQPVVENAIIHGFKNIKNGGLIQIDAIHEIDKVIIKVQDNGCGLTKDLVEKIMPEKKETKKESFGLWSIDERIKLYFGEEYGLRIMNAPEKGTLVKISIPYNI